MFSTHTTFVREKYFPLLQAFRLTYKKTRNPYLKVDINVYFNKKLIDLETSSNHGLFFSGCYPKFIKENLQTTITRQEEEMKLFCGKRSVSMFCFNTIILVFNPARFCLLYFGKSVLHSLQNCVRLDYSQETLEFRTNLIQFLK